MMKLLYTVGSRGLACGLQMYTVKPDEIGSMPVKLNRTADLCTKELTFII